MFALFVHDVDGDGYAVDRLIGVGSDRSVVDAWLGSLSDSDLQNAFEVYGFTGDYYYNPRIVPNICSQHLIESQADSDCIADWYSEDLIFFSVVELVEKSGVFFAE
jgi:hypothetical protein